MASFIDKLNSAGWEVAERLSQVAEVVVDALHEFGRHRCAATTNGTEAGRVALGEGLGFQEVPAHRRDTHEVGDVFLLDQFESTVRFPPVGHHELGAADERAEHDGHETGHMEQGNTQHERRRSRCVVGGRRLAECRDCGACGKRQKR